jgi:UDP-N-acetylmuramyl pentapeptide phosphotransferase/UDP-N-acetylglucosamine-1-phosphate transferase
MIWLLALVCVLTAAAGALGTWLLIRILSRRAILDHPNERSNHAVPTPRGGGLAVVPITLIAWTVTAGPTLQDGLLIVLGGGWALAVLSWIDDLRSLPAALRLAVQAIVIAVATQWLSGIGPIFQGLLPQWADTLATAVLWLWFVNLFNFMDGIDGISGVEAIGIAAGIAILGGFLPADSADVLSAAALAAAALGFLVWNWPPAKIFLGDVGSVPLGFLLGLLLLLLAARGYWAPALILPAYYLADATITISRRLLRGEKIWQAHSEHFYQHAVRAGRTHGQVSGAVLITNIILIGLAVLAISHPLPAVGGAGAIVAALLTWMRRPPAKPAS